ncbi:MAG TPA: alpha/beta hydrolase [Thermomicrobiales bacterium]|nr:alpha/beta hydrolase [Thermomicrobiales bacterium]
MDETAARNGKRRWFVLGAALGAAGGLAAWVARRRGGEAAPATGAVGQVVGDEEFFADERFIREGWREAAIDGWRTRIFDRGEGDPILFVPIIKGLETVYAKQLRAFAATNRVLLYERTESLDHPVAVGARAEELRKVLDHLDIARAHLVALGDAGIVAFAFAREYTHRCRSLAALCAGPRYRVPPTWLNEGIINPLFARLPVERVLPDRVVRAKVLKGLTNSGPLPPHLVGRMLDVMPEQVRLYKYSILPVTHDHEMRDWAHMLHLPVLLIDRDDDPVAPVADLEELAALLPQCYGLHVLRDGGRFTTYTHAGEVDRLLREFYDKLDAEGARPAASPKTSLGTGPPAA